MMRPRSKGAARVGRHNFGLLPKPAAARYFVEFGERNLKGDRCGKRI